MTERDPSKAPDSTEKPFKNDFDDVLTAHLDHAKPVDPGAVALAAELILTSYQGYGGKRDALGVCIDLVGKVSSDPTTVLGAMIASHHDAIPLHWQTTPQIARTILTMSSQLESGSLRARRTSIAHLIGTNDVFANIVVPQIDQRLIELNELETALQQK